MCWNAKALPISSLLLKEESNVLKSPPHTQPITNLSITGVAVWVVLQVEWVWWWWGGCGFHQCVLR